MKKIYISGPITGLQIEEYESNFQKAEDKFSAIGYEVVNPVKLNHDHDKTWNSYMRVDLIALLECDEIYMLKGSLKSMGAMIEFRLAKDLGMKFSFEN